MSALTTRGSDRTIMTQAPDQAPAVSHWMTPLLLTLAVQIVSSFLQRMPPAIAPALTGTYNLSPESIGYLSASNVVGAILFLFLGAPLLRRLGSVRSLQVGLLLGALGALLFALPAPATLLIATLMMGFGYGPSTPAGSDILQRHAPARHRSLIFSVKQAGVPVGGILAGLILPYLVELGGLSLCLWFAAGFAALTAFLMQPYRAAIDVERDRSQSLHPRQFLSFGNISKPINALRETPQLMQVAMSGTCLAVGQGIWISFLVTILVNKMSMSLTMAGLYFAIMQGAGVFGRVLLGWASDRLGSGRLTLRLAMICSALTTLCLPFVTPEWSLLGITLLCIVAGITVTSWNGVQIAEIAQLAPSHQVHEASSGATLVLFVGYVAGPAGFALLTSLTGSIPFGLYVTSIIIACGLLILPAKRPAKPADGRV